MSRAIGGLLSMLVGTTLLLIAAEATPAAQQGAKPGRALQIEDYYRIQTVGNPQISPDGRWVVYTVATRIEDDHSTRTEVHVVPADASASSRRIQHYGRDVTSPAWTRDSRLEYSLGREVFTIDPANAPAPPAAITRRPAGAVPSPDGQWIALARDKPRPKSEPVYASDFERRHEERFKGVTFDWKDFQRDGQPFPAPNLRARPAAQLIVQPADGARRGPSSTSICAPRTSRGIPTGSYWPSRRIPTGATS